MWQDPNGILNDYIQSTNTLKTNSLVYAEWNMNQPENIARIGNYRYRPRAASDDDNDFPFKNIPAEYDVNDGGDGGIKYYTGATDAEIDIFAGYDFDTLDEIPEPIIFTSKNEKMKMLYSLESCFEPFRPRSGINKLLYLGLPSTLPSEGAQYTNNFNIDLAQRPRYYMSSRYDQFKYWTSYRTEGGREYGVSGLDYSSQDTENYYITDACPFIVYENDFAANRLVVKVQTNVGAVDLGTVRIGEQSIPDPLYGQQNQTTPLKWRLEVLRDSNTWETVQNFFRFTLRSDGTPIFDYDGYLELQYGITNIPEAFNDLFIFAETIYYDGDPALVIDVLPVQAQPGYAYLVKSDPNDVGTFYVWWPFPDEDAPWYSFSPEYGWSIAEEELKTSTQFVTELVNPDYFVDPVSGKTVFREFDIIRGIRMVVETMNRPNCTLDLIELSPRLVADISDRAISFNVTKNMADMSNSSLPVGSLQADIGSISLSNNDAAFSSQNPLDTRKNLISGDTNPFFGKGSIIAPWLETKIKISFYEVFREIPDNGLLYDYYVPIKTMYTEGVPQASGDFYTIDLDLRDFFFYFEQAQAPSLLITDASLSYAISILLDYIGFSNYIFNRIPGTSDPVIPYFFVPQDVNVAEVLNDLARGTQSAMYFDEYNNFVVDLKEYAVPDADQRSVDNILLGQEMVYTTTGESYKFLGYTYGVSLVPPAQTLPEPYNSKGELKTEYVGGAFVDRGNDPDNMSVWALNTSLSPAEWEEVGIYSETKLPSIINLSSMEKRVYNAGQINYTTRYIQRTYASVQQAPYISQDKNWIYLPSLLWEVSASENIRSINDLAGDQSSYSLAAAPLNTTLSSNVPTVENNQIRNNVIDLGENVYWLTRHQGYLYANGEIIKYDAIQYAVQGAQLLEGESSVVWVTSNQEYQKYFSRLPFNGKMYPTGLVRIYSEPNYETIDNISKLQNGAVASHGRGQFGTPVVEHNAGLSSYWTDQGNLFGCVMRGDILFDTNETVNYPADLTPSPPNGENGNAGGQEKKSSITGIIKNYLSASYYTEDKLRYLNSALAGTIQSSALVFSGPQSFDNNLAPRDIISYVYKGFSDNDSVYNKSFKHYGTRMRIIGKVESDSDKVQTPIGSTQYVSIDPKNPEQQVGISGGGGGIGIMVNQKNNTGYFFELAALTTGNVNAYVDSNKKQIVSYNIASGNITWANNTVTVKTSYSHQLSVGDQITMLGTNQDAINISASVTSIPTPTSFTYSVSGGGSVTTGGTVESFVTTDTYINNLIFYKNVGQSRQSTTYNIASVSRSDGSTTLTTASRSDFYVGDSITVTGVSDPSFNGTFTITSVLNGLTITYAQGGQANASSSGGTVTYNRAQTASIPVKLWSGLANILVDDGNFVGQYRMVGEENPTVYDIAVEYEDVGLQRRFYLYLNNKQIATVYDDDPLPLTNSFCLYVRGSSKCMFENVYALENSVAENTAFTVAEGIASIFGTDEINATDALRKYAVSGLIQASYLSGISSLEPPKYSMYYDEFGTIMREAAYFNIKYDRAYPALTAQLSPTLNRLKGYTTSGFYAGSYGAEFLIFNCLDKNINLDSTTGNYLRIQGVTFTQNTTRSLTVDDYFNKVANLSNPPIDGGSLLYSPVVNKKIYDEVKLSRMKYGESAFSTDSNYIQTDDAAYDMMGWIIKKSMRPRKLVGVNTIGAPLQQLGDVLQINYLDSLGVQEIGDPSTNYVLYNMQYNKALGNTTLTMYLAEV